MKTWTDSSFNQGRDIEHIDPDQHEGEYLAWLLPVMMVVVTLTVMYLCAEFGWLQ